MIRYIRYFKIYIRLANISSSAMVVYRMSFINNLISSLVWAGLTIVTTLLITNNTKTLFGWTKWEILLLTGTYTLIWGIFNIFLSKNVHEMPYLIDSGRLDKILMLPVDSQFMVGFTRMNPVASIRLIIGSIVIFASLQHLGIGISLFTLLSYIVLLIFSSVIVYSVWQIALTSLIWFEQLSNLIDLMYSVSGMMRYPSEMYTNISQFIVVAFPFLLVSVIPTRFLLNTVSTSTLLLFSSASFFLLSLSILFWRRALRSYTSANG